MSFDAWVIGFGLSRVLIDLTLIASPTAYSVWLVVILVDLYLLYQYFADRSRTRGASLAVEVPNGRLSVRWQERASTPNDLRS